MADPFIATAADYADAMITARRATRTLVLLLLLLLLVQLGMFFLIRFEVLSLSSGGPTTQPSLDWPKLYHYVVGLSAFLGVTLCIVLGFVLLLIVNIMLVGRLIGVSRVTSAYIWCMLLLVLLFPWQAFLSHVGLTPDQAAFKLPGVLYTWYELTDIKEGAKFAGEPFFPAAFLKWARYAGFPLLAIILLLRILVLSGRGMKQALGEDEDMPPAESAE